MILLAKKPIIHVRQSGVADMSDDRDIRDEVRAFVQRDPFVTHEVIFSQTTLTRQDVYEAVLYEIQDGRV